MGDSSRKAKKEQRRMARVGVEGAVEVEPGKPVVPRFLSSTMSGSSYLLWYENYSKLSLHKTTF